MLSLQSASRERWLKQVSLHLPEILIDHAHCEKKAAACAMNLIIAYVDHPELVDELVQIVNEELDHFRQVLALLSQRNIPFSRQLAGGYGRQLNDLVRKFEPARAIDRFLIASLIEARSCERFALLRDHVADPQLAEFYGSLFESEARHHTTYVRMAKTFGSDDEIRQRLEELSALESEIIHRGDSLPRMHS
ncbi:MAG: tRNA-(ms[2]io[6]A)-hydroxylase [Pirellulaceae bacterium]